MLKNLKKVAAIVLSFAMAVQFGLADSYYVNAVEEPVEPQQQEETTTTAPQEQEEVPTTEEETPQQQEEGQQQPAVEEEQPAAEEAQPQPQPVEQAKVNVSYVKEDDTKLMESVTPTYDVGYRLDQDTNVFKEAHEAFEFEYAFVNGNKENKITKDQVKASGLTVTSDMTSLTLVYKEKASTEKPKKANKQEPAKTETTSESDDVSDVDTTEYQETAVQLTEFFVVASQNQVTKGETAQLTLTIKPDNYPNKDVTWSSSNDATATVDENGVVTTLEVGTVTITAILKSDPTISSSVTIVVNPIKVSKITVNGYDKDYLVKGGTVTLTTTIEPSDAANKSIVWSSSNEKVATVDQNGRVTAVGQGTVSIKAMNDESGVYGEQVITVYDNTPITKRVNVWVTNESQGVSYQFNIPVNGTEVSPSQVARNTTKGDKTLVSTAQFRVLKNTVAQQRVWATISSVPIVKSFKYNQKRKKVEYTTDGQTWKTISSDEQIYDFTSMQWTGTDNNTDVKVAVGDWPYGAGVATSHNKQTIQIIVLNTENNDAQVYNSGVMRYDNGSNGNYGKIYFDCDTSKFEVSKVEVYRNGSLKESYTGSKIPKLINVQFEYNQTNKYVVKAYIKAKTIHVNYDANKGTGAPKGTTVKSTDKVTVDSTTRPTRDGYIFTGWTYGGKLYQGGESFDAPTSDVTFVAQWAKASDVINYTVNDSKMGSVSRSYERIGETVQGNVQGSTAIAETGYRFVKWVKGTDPKVNAVSTDVEYKPTTKGTYMAVFEAVTSDLVIRYVDTDGKDISDSETKSYKYGESYTVKAKEIPGYRLISQATITGTKGVAREEIRFIYEAIPVIVTIKGKTDSKVYTGNPQKVEGFEVESIKDDKGNSISGYSENDVALAEGKTAVAEGTDVGTYNMGLTTESFVNTNTNFKNVTFVVAEDGSMTITQKSIIPDGPNTPEDEKTGITVTDPADSIYDGKAHVNPLTVRDTKTGKDLVENKDYTLTYIGDVVNVGTVKIEVKGIGNYTGEFTKKYQITPREYTVTTDSANKTYDGTALTAGGHVNGLAEGETVIFKTTGSQINEGTSDNTYELKFEGTAVRTNYKHGKDSIGQLKVIKKSIVPDDKNTPDEKKTDITVNEPSDSKYDGKEHKEVLTVTDTKTGKELVAGTDYSVTYSSDLVNAGTVTIKVAGLGNYTGSFTKTYKITKRSVTLASATVSKVYDGSALTNTDIAVSGDGFVEGEGASYEVTGTQTEVGNSANAFEYKLNEKTLASNYNITKVVGTLTITAAPAPVTPATPSTPSTPSSTTSTTLRTPSAPQVTTPVETVEKETTPKAEPKKEEKVEEEYTPKASPQYYWALINLICAILTVLFGLLLLISKRHKSEDDDEEDDETKQQTNNDDEEKEQEKKRGLFTRVLAVLIAIASVVFFLVTEDLSLPWTWTDQWTIWMVVIGLVQIVVFFVGRKWKNVDNDDEDEEAQQA